MTVGSMRGGSASQDPGYSTVYGTIRVSQMIKIVITWKDGQIQLVAVQESAYVAARIGGMDTKKVEAFNGQSELVYITEHQR